MGKTLEYLFGTSAQKSEDEQEDVSSSMDIDDVAIMKEYLLKEMQKKGNQIIIDKNGKTETYFYAAQRLKLANTLESSDPCKRLSRRLLDKLVAIAKFCPTVATRSTETVREEIKYIADYLSEHVLISVPEIDAFVKLLKKMEAKGDAILVETCRLEKIKKSYKDAADDLKSFLTAKDEIGKSDFTISNTIRTNLKKLFADAQLTGYDLAIMNQVIYEQLQILTSFLLLQREKTDALEELKDYLDNQGDTTILVHGNVRKSCKDAMYLLHGKTADHLRNVPDPHPIVIKKLQIKLTDLFKGLRDIAHRPIMNTVLDEASNYLAYNFTQPLQTKTCTCANSTYMECNNKEKGNQRDTVRPLCRCNQMDGSGPSTRPGISIAECPVMESKTKDGAPPPCTAQDEGQRCPGE